MIGVGAIPGVDLLTGDAAAVLAGMDAGSAQCCVTSPPYFQLRDYGHPDQLGMEATPRAFVAALVAVFGAVKRVLRDDGTLWVNLADSYGPNKQMQLIPHRFAIAMQEDGWICRMDNVWAKSSAMPESCTDRCTRSHEYIFMFTKQPRYYYDAAAIAQPSVTNDPRRPHTSEGARSLDGRETWHSGERRDGSDFSTRNRRSVWADIPPEPSGAEHYAAYPTRLPELCLLAGSSPTACGGCGSPWRRVVERVKHGPPVDYEGKWQGESGQSSGRRILANVRAARAAGNAHDAPFSGPRTTGWAPTCTCPPDDTGRCTVLDPFSGSGSTGVAALRNGRRYIGIDLKDEYHAIARRRLERAHYETTYGVRHERERVADGQLPMFVSSAGEGPG